MKTFENLTADETSQSSINVEGYIAEGIQLTVEKGHLWVRGFQEGQENYSIGENCSIKVVCGDVNLKYPPHPNVK